MAKHDLPTAETLRQLLRYEADTGKLFWREAPAHLFKDGKYPASRVQKTWNAANAGKPALSYLGGDRTYMHGSVMGVKVYAHRAILAMELGRWPIAVDHINGVRSDNRRENLREVTIKENARNTRLRPSNESGHHGVTYRRDRGIWRARIKQDGREVLLGHFRKKEDAIEARLSAEASAGYHVNHGAR